MKKIFSLIVVIILAITLVGCKKDSGDYITVGLEADYPPFNWYETSKNDYNHPIHGQRNAYVAGYDLEVAKFVAEKLGKELRIKMIAWDSLSPALTTGEIDLIIAGMSPTEERKLTIDFTNPYYTSNHVAVVLANGKYANITGLEGLRGSKGMGQKGTLYAKLVDFVGENHGATVQPVADTVPLITTSILNGGTDFTIVEKPVALGMVAADSRLKIVLDVTENIFNVLDEDREISIGIRKEYELKEDINKILATITQELRNNWMDTAVERAGN